MDLTPPSLTRSPVSPPNTYCASESDLDYPSPGLLDQQYKISSVYGAESSCSMAQHLDSETSLPPLEAMTQAEWNSPTIMAVTSSTMPNVLSAEYDPFASYDSPLPGPYSQDVYPPPPSHPGAVGSPTASGAELASRSPAPASRSPFNFNPPTSAPARATLAPRLKVEGAGADYSPVEVSHYPSPRSIHAPYVSEPGPYPATPSTFLGDVQAQSWPRPHEYDAPQTYYHEATNAASAFMADRRMRVNRPRRAPRRLTTKEEANFQCEVKGCGKLFSRSYNFKAHMETHDEKREYPFPCSVNDCNKKFVRKTDLQRHHQSVHMKERNHKCDYCSRLFARKDTLRRFVANPPLTDT